MKELSLKGTEFTKLIYHKPNFTINILFSDDEDLKADNKTSDDEVSQANSRKFSSEKKVEKKPRKIFENYSRGQKISGNELGEWEKHTKGIGAKLLFQVSLLIYRTIKLSTNLCSFHVIRWVTNQAKVRK